MHSFGTTCFACVQNKTKLDPRSAQGIFVRYYAQSPAYLIYFPNKEEIRRVRCVLFHESQQPNTDKDNPFDYFQIPTPLPREDIDKKNKEDNSETSTLNENITDERKYPQRKINKLSHLSDYVLDSNNSDIPNCSIDYCYRIRDIPKTYE